MEEKQINKREGIDLSQSKLDRRSGKLSAGQGRPLAALTTVIFAAGSVLVLAGLVLSTACATGAGGRILPYDEALRQVHERGDSLAFGGLRVGMSRDEVERELGSRLPPFPAADPLCDYHYLPPVEYLGHELGLAFTGTTRSARLASITILIPGGAPFDAPVLVDRLESRLGPLELIPSNNAYGQGPHQMRRPAFRTENGGTVFLNPDRGISFGEVCYD